MEKITPEAIKSMRKRFGVSQQELASMLRMSVKTLGAWEQRSKTSKLPVRIPTSLPERILQILCSEKHGHQMYTLLSDASREENNQ